MVFSFEHVQRGSVSLKMCFFNNAFSPYRELVILRPKDERKGLTERLSSAEAVPLRKSCFSARTCYYVFTSASKTSNLVL